MLKEDIVVMGVQMDFGEMGSQTTLGDLSCHPNPENNS